MKKKTIALLLVLVMIFGISVGGTIAYLTDKEAVTNTFTVGNVKIKLTETAVNEAGVPVDEKGSTEADSTDANWKAAVIEANDSAPVGNKYKLIPGMSYTKDPAVTLLEGSEKSYVRMRVTVTYNTEADAILAKYGYERWFDFSSDWGNATLISTEKTDTQTVRTYEFRYKEAVGALEADNALPALFTKIKIPGTINNEELAKLANLSIAVEAHAMQAAGFDDAEDAWGAWTVNN